MISPVDSFTPQPGDSRETCSKCGGPRTWPDQKLCARCRAKYNRAWRADQAALRAQLPRAVSELVTMAGEFRALCQCPPGAGCPECADRRARAARLERTAMLIAPLARTRPLTGG